MLLMGANPLLGQMGGGCALKISTFLGPPSPFALVMDLPAWFQGGGHSLAGEGTGAANSDEGTDALVQYNPSTGQIL